MPEVPSRGIFLSYRRKDSAPYAVTLKSELSKRIPDAEVFMDLDSIRAGRDYAEVIRDAIDSSAVLVALIGRRWAVVGRRRRLDDPADWVRSEIREALERGVLVIPVLVDEAKPLRPEQLPAELQQLARLHAFELSIRRFKEDQEDLLNLIQHEVAKGRDAGPAAAAATDGGSDRTAPLARDDQPQVAQPPMAAGGPGPDASRKTASRLRRAVRRRSVIIATAVGIVVIGLATGLVIAFLPNHSSAPSVPSTSVRWDWGGEIYSSPSVADGTVYFGTFDSKVDALDAATGHLRWSYPTGGRVFTSPAVADGFLYVGSFDHKVYALDAATGKLRWSYPTGGTVLAGPTVVGGVVYVGSEDDTVYALDAATGKLRWSYPTGGPVDSSPTVADGTVYVGSGDGNVYALDAATGKPSWSYPTADAVDSSPTVAAGIVYVGSDDHNVYALDAATGQRRWTFRTGGYVDSGPTVADSTVYVGSWDDKVYALDAGTGTLRWAYPTAGFIYSRPTVAGGTVYLGSHGDKVYALDAVTGQLRWAFTTGGPVDYTPAVVGSTVYVGSANIVYALSAGS